MSATQQAASVRTSLLLWCCRKGWIRTEASFTRWGERASSTLSQSARYLEQAWEGRSEGGRGYTVLDHSNTCMVFWYHLINSANVSTECSSCHQGKSEEAGREANPWPPMMCLLSSAWLSITHFCPDENWSFQSKRQQKFPHLFWHQRTFHLLQEPSEKPLSDLTNLLFSTPITVPGHSLDPRPFWPLEVCKI